MGNVHTVLSNFETSIIVDATVWFIGQYVQTDVTSARQIDNSAANYLNDQENDMIQFQNDCDDSQRMETTVGRPNQIK